MRGQATCTIQAQLMSRRRAGHDNVHVRGYKEEGTTTPPFDMRDQRP
jgi:phosphoketolase